MIMTCVPARNQDELQIAPKQIHTWSGVQGSPLQILTLQIIILMSRLNLSICFGHSKNMKTCTHNIFFTGSKPSNHQLKILNLIILLMNARASQDELQVHNLIQVVCTCTRLLSKMQSQNRNQYKYKYIQLDCYLSMHSITLQYAVSE